MYDASGVRICKIVKPKNPGGTPKGQNEWTYTYYVTDATGNVVATYDRSLLPSENPAFDFKDQLVLSELHLFGSSRLGMIKPGAVKNRMLEASVSETPVTVYSDESNTIDEYLLTGIDYGELSGLVKENTGLFRITAGKKVYELTNHLGNVNVIISDQKIAIEGASGEVDYYAAEILSITDYYAFGSPMYGRVEDPGKYRYGFNGQEKETEITGSESHTSAEFWMYDSRIVRRWNVDPVIKNNESPYATLSGNPIKLNDPNGDNAKDPSTHIDDEGNVIAEYDDGDDGVYVHEKGITKEIIDQRREGCDPMCSNPNTDGGGQYIGRLGGDIYMDWVGMYSKKIASSTNETLSLDFKFGDWYNKVKQFGDWDLKNNKKTIWGVAWAYDQGRKGNDGTPIYTRFISQNISFFNAADFGNYHAGYTGSMFGIPIIIQKIGAGMVEQLKDVTNGDFEDAWNQYLQSLWFWERTSLMDNPTDYWYNRQGMADGLYMKKTLHLGPGSKLEVIKVK